MKRIYKKALDAMSENYWGEPCKRGPWWARLIWFTRHFVPQSWVD